jgi:hypothetical protein
MGGNAPRLSGGRSVADETMKVETVKQTME